MASLSNNKNMSHKDSVINKLKDMLIKSRKGISDVAVSLVPQVISAASGFIVSILLARGLGASGMGKYSLVTSVSGLVIGLSDLGISQTAIRFASRAVSLGKINVQREVFRWAFRIRMLIVTSLTLIVILAAHFISAGLWHDQNLDFLIKLSLLTGIFGALSSIPTMYYQSLKDFKKNAMVSVIQTLINMFSIVIIFLLNKTQLKLVISANVLATAFGALIFLSIVPRDIFIGKKSIQKFSILDYFKCPNVNDENQGSSKVSEMGSFALYMIISAIAVTITLRSDVWLMGFYLNKSQVGLYSVASRFTLPLTMLLGALNTVLWPRASSVVDKYHLKQLLKKTFGLSIGISILTVLYSIFAPLIAPYIFGETYRGSTLLGQILCIRYSIAILICPIGVIGYSFGMVKIYSLINIIQLVAVIATNIILLPLIGPTGAAIALIINELINFFIVGGIIYKKAKL